MNFRSTPDTSTPSRRERRRREARRRSGLTALIASLTVGALLALGLPTVALAGETGGEPAAVTAGEPETDSEGEAPAAPPDEEASEPPAEEPAEEVPAEEPPAEEPPAEEPPTEEPPAEEQPPAPPAEESRAPADVTPFAAFPADTADCTTNCANLTITNVVVGGTASPNDWALHAVRQSNSDNYNFASTQTRPVPRSATYTIAADNGPAGYALTGFQCSTGGSGGGDPTWDQEDRTVTYGGNAGKFAACTFTHTFVQPATITVQVGGDRTGLSAVSGLAGVQLELYTNAGGSLGVPVAQPWSTCTSDAAGSCVFTVPAPTGAQYWVVQRAAPNDVPAGWFSNDELAIGTDPSAQRYAFITPAVGSGAVINSNSNFMLASGNTNNVASGGIWQNSRTNPTSMQQCGIDVALIIDLSGSVAPFEEDLKEAAKGFVDALTGTPSQIGLFTFNNVAPASVGGNLGITPVSTPAGAETVKDHIDGFGTPTEATNWDRGIYQVATSGVDYDLAVVLTDGNPTVYSNDEGPGNRTRFREVENGVFSANAVKALATRIVAVGVGDGVGGDPENLIAISGPTANSDYYQTDDYTQAGQALRDLALGNCEGSVSVVKQVVDAGTTGEQKTGATPTGGWEFTAAPTTGGITPLSQNGSTAAGTGAVNFPLNFAGGTVTGTVSVDETQQPGYSVVTTGGKNAVCTNVGTGASVTVTNTGPDSFTVPVTPSAAISCTVWNRPPLPQADVRVDKVWVVNGQTFQHGNQPIGLTAQLQLDDVNRPFGVVQTGYTANGTVKIGETTGVGTRTLCQVTSSRVTLANGQVADQALPYTPTLQPGSNSYTITNVVTCAAELTLVKQVANGDAAPGDWTLDAVAPVGSLPGPNGLSGVVAPVTPNVRYPLVEDGDPRYVQSILQGGQPIPPSTGSWNCVQTDAQGNVVPGFSDGINGGVTVPLGFRVRCTAVNETATLTLLKIVDPIPGVSADPSEWDLTATPQAPAIPGLEAQTVTSGQSMHLRPGKPYTLSESGGPDGWEQVSLQCSTGPNGTYVDATSVTLPALGTATCVFRNEPVPPKLSLDKVVTDDVADPAAWTLSASDGDDVVASGAGGTGGFVEVPAGVELTLAESTDLPNADQFQAGAWVCSLNGGPDVPGPVVPALDAGDEVECVVTNTLKPFVPTIVKNVAVPVPQGDAWLVTYTIDVTNPSAFAAVDYDLQDQLEFGGDLTIDSAEYTDPDGATTAWSVPFGDVQELANSRALAPAETETWTIAVVATVDAGAFEDPENQLRCPAPTSGEAGGFLNSAWIIVDEQEVGRDDACAEPVNPTIAKTGGTAVDHGDGTWTLPYTVTVTNPSATTAVEYDLDDVLDLPAGVTATGPATIVSAPAGVTPVAGWTGAAPNTRLAEDVVLPGTAGLDQHVYEIAVTVTLDAQDGPFACPAEDGLNNVATLHSGNQETDATGCVEIELPDVTIDKSVVPGSVSQGGDGLWTIAYRLDVANTGEIGGVYSLADELHFGAGVDLGGASYAVTLNGGPAPLAWTGSGDLVVDRYLAGGASDVWIVTVSGIALDGPELTPQQTACPADDVDGAFNNAGILTVGGDQTIDTACDSPSAPQVTKTEGTAVQQPDATWDVSYLLAVFNDAPGAKPSHYTLVDDPHFPAALTINSYTIDEILPTPGNLVTDASPVPASIPVVANEPIAAGAVHVYRITLNVTVPSGLPPVDRLCVPGEPGKGFFNEAVLTSGEIVDRDDNCPNIREGGQPTVTKDDPTVSQDADGVWTAEYELTVTGNPEFISTYTLEDTLRFGPEVEVLSAEWSGEGDSGTWADPETDPTTTIVGTATPIGIDEVHTYTVTVTATVDAAAFEDPTTTTCQPSLADPDVGFLNAAILTSDGAEQIDLGCGLPARPIIEKTTVGSVTEVGDHWEATYELTVQNGSPTQALVYDLTDAPDFTGAVTITDREVTSADVTVNPAWNGAGSTDDLVVEDQLLAGGATHTFTVTVSFTVGDTEPDDPTLLCEGEGGQGLLNGAVVVSGGSWESEACFDVPVDVELLKYWVIDGGEPIVWDDPALPAGFSAQALLDGVAVDWGEESGPYELGDTVEVDEADVVVPAGCELVGVEGDGTYTLELAHNRFDVTNEVDCTQTVNLAKVVDNQHGGDAVPSDWTLSASGPDDGFGGNGTASGPVELNVGYLLNEVSTIWDDGVEYQVSATWSCTSEQGEDAFTLVAGPNDRSATLTVTELGATVDCEITNTDVAPELTLEKVVEPEAVAELFPPTLWTLEASDGDGVVLSGAGSATGEVESNTGYGLSEAATFPEAGEFEAGDWECVVTNAEPPVPATIVEGEVVLQPGQEVTCTIVNTARPATYLFDKTLVSVEQQPDGDWEIVYDVTVENESAVSPVTYGLEDSLDLFGELIEIDSADWTGPAGASGSWTGLPDDRVETLADGALLAPGATDTYTVTVLARTLVGAVEHPETQCTPPGEFERGGFRNLAVLTVNEQPLERSVCADPEFPTAVKTVSGGPILNGDDTDTVEYEIAVTGAETLQTHYDLSDAPVLPDGVTFTATAEDPDGNPVAGWTGTGAATALAADRPIGAGEVEVWTITVVADVSELTTIDDARCVEETEGKGFYNGAVFSTGLIETPLEACTNIPPVDVGIEKTYDDLPEGETAVEAGDAFTWVLTVTNHGDPVENLEVTDLIDDELEVTGPAVIEPAADPAQPGTWLQVSGGTDNAFAATYTGIYPEGAVTTIRIPVLMKVPPAGETPPAVGPDDPPPVLPPLGPSTIPNRACVEITGAEPEEELALSDGEIAPLQLPLVLDLEPDNDCADAEVPVKRIDAGVYVRCVNDVPWLYYDIQVTDNVEPGPVTVTWTSADGTLTKEEVISPEDLSGRLLWPGAAVDENGVPYQFPGWRPVTEADLTNPPVPGTRFLDLILDENVATYPWRDMENPATITFEVNPSQSVLAVYPQALPTCAIDRPPLLEIEKTSSVTSAKPGSSFEYTLQVRSTGIGAAEPVTLIDEIPADLRVDAITTAGAPAFPRWEGCEVTGRGAGGYGGTLRCELLGVLGPNITEAPPVTLDVTLRPTSKATSLTNTGEVCYGEAPGDDANAQIVCADSSVRITVPQPLAVTGFAGGPLVWVGASLLLLGGIAVVLAISRRRRGDAAG
ncbi:hypothetical protein ABIQ69_12070 [Agromyces sp. G08B096]|uniref:VWFA domain-containing protein n=1 Tax=Agromyces sp. G08B096 TaxID=3156399 RepID=A0AAU7W4E1_9MICO